MCVVYLVTSGYSLGKNGGRGEVRDNEKKTVYSVPLEDIDSVVIAAKASVSPEMVYHLLECKVPISYIDYRGRLLGTMGGADVSVERLLAQKNCFSQAKVADELTRYVLRRKLANQRELLRIFAKRHDDSDLHAVADSLKSYIAHLDTKDMHTSDEWMGLEGQASKIYFYGFSLIIDSDLWNFNGRNRRPPRDPVNSMLSYGYAFLEKEVRRGIVGCRLDPRIGFLHSNNGRKDSLVYDLMEMFRQNIIDRFVLRMINKRVLVPLDFSCDEDNGCMFSDAAKKKWIAHYEQFMSEPLKALGEKSCRDYINYEVERFAETVWNVKLTA